MENPNYPEEIAKQEKRLLVAKQILEIVTTWEGKALNKRLATATEKALPEYTISWHKDYSNIKFCAWGNGIDYDNMISFYIHEPAGWSRYKTVNDCYVDLKEQCENLIKYTKESIEKLNADSGNFELYLAELKELDNKIAEAKALYYPEKSYVTRRALNERLENFTI